MKHIIRPIILLAIIIGIIAGCAIGKGWYYATTVVLMVSAIFIISRKYLPEEMISASLLILCLPWVNEFGYGPIEFGFTIYPSYIFAFIGIIFMIKNKAINRDYTVLTTPLDKPLFLLLFILFASILQSRFIPPLLLQQASANSIFNQIPGIRSYAQVAAIVYMTMVYYFIINVIRTKKDYTILLKVLFFSGAILSLYGLLYYYLQYYCSFLGDPYGLYYGKSSLYFNSFKI